MNELSPDTQRAHDSVLRGGRLTEMIVDSDDPIGFFDGGDRDVLVQRALSDILRIRGQDSLVVQGDVIGEADRPLSIEMQGDVIVTGMVRYAQIRASRCFVAGDVHRVKITTARSTTIGGMVHGSQFVSGNYEETRRTIESLRMSRRHGAVELESLSRRVTTEEKRLERSYAALRIPLDFNVGRVVQHTEGGVHICLDAFYASVDGRPAQEVDRALNEFFTRGMIGVITRQNRKNLVNYPAREKVFLQLITSLRAIFQDVLRRDNLSRSLDDMSSRLQQQMDALEERRAFVEMGGVAGNTEMEFILAQVVPLLRDDGFDFAHRSAHLDIWPLHGLGAAMVSRDADGGQSAATLTSAELGALRFHVDGSRIVWESSEAAAFA
jgi:hypothetical protein